MDPLEYCDICFIKGRPHLCETFKGTFTKISTIHFSQQNNLSKILNGLGVRPKLVEKRWTCMLDKSQRATFLNSLWRVGVTAHTLDDHVRILTNLYKSEVRYLGQPSIITIPEYGTWKVFDQQTRKWETIDISKKQDHLTAKIRVGAVLQYQNSENPIYYRTVSNGNKIDLVPVEKRAAYNLIITQCDFSKIYWQTDKKNQSCFIKSESLENLPEEISSTLLRLGSKKAEYLMFDMEDYELIHAILRSAKLTLEKSSEIAELEKDDEKDTTSILLDEIEKERISSLCTMITELGGKVEEGKSHIVITGKLDSVKLGFIKSEQSIQEGKMILVSLSALQEPQRIAELLLMLKKRLGLLAMSIENLVCRHWPIVTDGDLQYTVQSLIEYSKIDKNLALSIVNDQKKFNKINEWNNKIKEGKIRSNLDTVTLGKILKLRS